MLPNVLYKIISKSNWQQSQTQTHVELPAIDDEFIHLALEEQVPRILEKFWPNDPEAVILKLAPQKLEGRLVLEKNPGGSMEYYHLYDGAIPREAIIGIMSRTNF